MLAKKLKSLLSYHLQAALESFNYLWARPVATSITVTVIASALALPALFWVFTDNVSELTENWQHGGSLTVYLKSDLTKQQEQAVLDAVQKTEHVGSSTFKSPDEGLSELTHQEGMKDIMQYLPKNPLPAVIEVTPSADLSAPSAIEAFASQLKSITNVNEVKIDMEWLRRLHAIVAFSSQIAHTLFALLALAVMLIIANTLRLSIQNQHEEIQILKLIGAQDTYIIRPFLYSGIWYGIAGAIVAQFLVNLIVLSLGSVVDNLASVYQMHYPLTGMSISQILLLLLFAIILGWLAACLSVKRQLAAIEPC